MHWQFHAISVDSHRQAAQVVGPGICYSCEELLSIGEPVFYERFSKKMYCESCKTEIENGETVHCDSCHAELVVGMANFIGAECGQVVLCNHCRWS